MVMLNFPLRYESSDCPKDLGIVVHLGIVL